MGEFLGCEELSASHRGVNAMELARYQFRCRKYESQFYRTYLQPYKEVCKFIKPLFYLYSHTKFFV
jgi:hypothetical protein